MTFCSEFVIPDPLKSGVTRAGRYGPGAQRSYDEWGQHYDTHDPALRVRAPIPGKGRGLV